MMKKTLIIGLILAVLMLPGLVGNATAADEVVQAYHPNGVWHEWAQTWGDGSYVRFEAAFDVHNGVAVTGCIHWTFYYHGANIGGGDSYFYTTSISEQTSAYKYDDYVAESWVQVTNLPSQFPYVNYLPQIHSWYMYT